MHRLLFFARAGWGCFALITLLSWSPGALASDAGPASDAAPDKGLEEVVVTAEKRDSTVQGTPISISAVSGEQLESKGIQSVEDLAATVPGISMRTAGPGQTEYEMRGLSSSGGAVSTVGFYLDETPLSASAVALNGRTVIDADLFDLNHAEVLRGPQGTLYGAGSMGGTIKLVTNAPKLGAFEGAVSADLSETGDGGGTNGGGNLMLNIPIGDIAALRIVETDKYISGWVKREVVNPFPFPTNFGNCGPYYFCTRGDVQDAPVEKVIDHSNNERFTSTRAALLVKPTDRLSMTASVMYQRIDADGYNNYGSPGAVNTLFQPYDIQEPYYDSFKLASFTLHYDFDFAQLTSATSYWKRDVVQSQDSTEALQNIFNLTQFLPTLYQEEDPTRQISEELRLTSSGTGPFQWLGGLYAADLHSGYITTNQSLAYATATSCLQPYSGGNCPADQTYNPNSGGQAANPNGIIFDDNNPNVTKQSAVFGEASYKLTSALKATVGLRYFKFDVRNNSYQTGLGTGTGNASPTIGTSSGSGKYILPKFNLSYEPTPDLTVYGTVAKGARPGGVNLPIPLTQGAIYYCGPGSGPSFVTQQPSYYGPDSVLSFEVGEKSRFDDQRFTINADAYYVKWTNIQQVIALSCGYPYNTNAGQAKAYGPELEMTERLFTGLSVSLSGTYTKAYIDSPAAGLPINPGTDILNVPQYTGMMSLDYTRALAGDLQGIFWISESYVGPIQDVAYYRETLGSHGLMDMRIGVARNAWSAYLFGTNLTDKHAALTIDNTTFAWQQPTVTRVSTNQPRTIGLEARFKF